VRSFATDDVAKSMIYGSYLKSQESYNKCTQMELLA